MVVWDSVYKFAILALVGSRDENLAGWKWDGGKGGMCLL